MKELYECINCNTIADIDKFKDVECDGDINGICPKCKKYVIMLDNPLNIKNIEDSKLYDTIYEVQVTYDGTIRVDNGSSGRFYGYETVYVLANDEYEAKSISRNYTNGPSKENMSNYYGDLNPDFEEVVRDDAYRFYEVTEYIEEEIKESKKEIKIDTSDLNKEQQTIHDDILKVVKDSINNPIDNLIGSYAFYDHRMCSLQGGAGTGKSFLTSRLVKSLINQNLNITMTAPTHQATRVIKEMCTNNNLDVKAKTIHSYLKLKMKIDYKTGKQVLETSDKEIDKTDVLLIDESSMIDELLMGFIKEAVQQNIVKFVLFIGDTAQANPIGSKQSSLEVKNKYTLKTIVRQAKGNPIISLATVIRTCIEKKQYPSKDKIISLIKKFQDTKEISVYDDFNLFMTHYFEDTLDRIVLGYTNNKAVSYNGTIRTVLKGSNLPNILENEAVIFQEAHSEDEKMIHMNNEIVTVNSIEDCYNEEYDINYHLCHDVSLDNEVRTFNIISKEDELKWKKYLKSLADRAKEAKYVEKKFLWEAFWKAKGFIQETKFVYSQTTSKSQGDSFDSVYIDFNDIFNDYSEPDDIFRLLYVAITRSKNTLTILI